MKFIEIEHVNNNQIMLIQNELNNLYYIALERCNNYAFTPDYVSKPYKSKSGARGAFNRYIKQYKAGLLV